jgi:glutamate-1-semialdehyde 2,1-aminomutase
MRRFKDDRPSDVCFARGTFNTHPYVIAAMREFLVRIASSDIRRHYEGLDARWDARVVALNSRLAAEGVPVRAANLVSIWTLCYTTPSRYNWMFQYYLRAEGLALSWVGTGRLIFSHNYTDAEVAEVIDRIVAAARAMANDGWWAAPSEQTNVSIRRQVARELLATRLGWRA